MYNSATFVIFFLYLGLAGARPSGGRSSRLSPSNVITPYIVGGVEAIPGEFPWQLSLQRGLSHSCGASLLSPNSALSAAHCVDGALVSSVQIVCGLHYRSDTTNAQTVQAAAFNIHPNYDNGDVTFAYDIAIVEIASSMDTSVSNCQVLTLPPDNSEQFVGSTCTMTGWGKLSPTDVLLPDALQKADMTVLSTQQCDFIMIGIIGADCTDANIAAYDPSGTKAFCTGDSGGPLNCPLSGQSVVAGLASWGIAGESECNPEYPSMYTRVSHYLTWIIDNTP